MTVPNQWGSHGLVKQCGEHWAGMAWPTTVAAQLNTEYSAPVIKKPVSSDEQTKKENPQLYIEKYAKQYWEFIRKC